MEPLGVPVGGGQAQRVLVLGEFQGCGVAGQQPGGAGGGVGGQAPQSDGGQAGSPGRLWRKGWCPGGGEGGRFG
ncbi:hypothetical protein [Streptomyces sp. RPT161]|uniref:hypothetical protein n=1 Tax=Streptomyces sp. RPT161 TaxID=3015993 RepID=UPI0022B8B12A|nr:hypothetical protein [Streptomyces sp. RPT161]